MSTTPLPGSEQSRISAALAILRATLGAIFVAVSIVRTWIPTSTSAPPLSSASATAFSRRGASNVGTTRIDVTRVSRPTTSRSTGRVPTSIPCSVSGVERHSSSNVEAGSNVPVGLFGLHTNAIAGFCRSSAWNASRGNARSGRYGRPCTRIPCCRAQGP